MRIGSRLSPTVATADRSSTTRTIGRPNRTAASGSTAPATCSVAVMASPASTPTSAAATIVVTRWMRPDAAVRMSVKS